ncbi:unnamed protein product [Zymoseptoria tritici ST99CH_3D7]|uniref:Uncharacterized protein n=1 Tax=Zymoseptoria tritici (strain ST99CH_3D7) TaxID=1276538 RepID=A0A1X7S7X3_ZYMT9|nr:unnamed protein product [Zymoseptoria tritici ST99CH_3D7]
MDLTSRAVEESLTQETDRLNALLCRVFWNPHGQQAGPALNEHRDIQLYNNCYFVAQCFRPHQRIRYADIRCC